MNERKLHITED